jgi:hypothetical protein
MRRLFAWAFPNHPHIQCGLHSGFPVCCILFYVLFWLPVVFGEMRPFKLNKRFIAWWHSVIDRVCERRALCYWSEYNPVDARRTDTKLGEITIGFGRIACPWCALFSKHVGHIKCACTYATYEAMRKKKQ